MKDQNLLIELLKEIKSALLHDGWTHKNWLIIKITNTLESPQPTVTQQGNAEDMQAKLLDIHSNLLLGNVVEANRITLALIKSLDESNPPTQVGEDVYNSLRYAVEIIKAFAENFSYDHDLDASVKKMERILQSQTSPPAPDKWPSDKMELLFEFSSMQQWINKAQSWFKKHSLTPTLCLDNKGNVVHVGEDFQIASDHDLYPVKVYKLKRTKDWIKSLKK